MCAVLLQGRAEPAEALLPASISGYASAFVAPGTARPSRPAVAAVPPEQRALFCVSPRPIRWRDRSRSGLRSMCGRRV